jgi:hypothetical protein
MMDSEFVELPGYQQRRHENYNGNVTPMAQKNAFLHAHNPKHLELLKTLTKLQSLQSLDIAKDLGLPQIIVCGLQSSGKSSVLEAITEIPFPRSEGTCTRFVTKVTLRPDEDTFVQVAIEKKEPLQSQYSDSDFLPITDLENLSDELQAQFDRAADAILGNQRELMFSKNILSITICGPDRPILQILDLPGLITYDTSDKKTNKKNIGLVEDIVVTEMKKPNSTILAVLSAEHELELQGILTVCEEHDPDGERTVGIITKPDEVRDEKVDKWMAVAQGLKDEINTNRRWHVLRNRSREDMRRNTSIEERNAVEEAFFRREPWVHLGADNLGIVTLRTRLSKILLDAASKEFPELATKIGLQLRDNRAELKRHGGDNMTDRKRQDIFSYAAEDLKRRTNDYVDGKYKYDTSSLDASHPIHLRSRIVEQSELFRDRIIFEGHEYASQLEPSGINPDSDLVSIAKKLPDSEMAKLEPISKTRDVEIQEAKKHLDEKRGMELPGTFSPQHINDFFWKQSKPWNSIAQEHVVKVLKHCELYFQKATLMAFGPDSLRSEKPMFSNHEDVAGRVYNRICKGLERMKLEAEGELNKIEIDRTQFQLNFNPRYLAEYRQQRNARNAARAIDAVVKDAALQSRESKRPMPELNPNTLAEHQHRHTQDDRTREEAEDFLKSAWLQYKV